MDASEVDLELNDHHALGGTTLTSGTENTVPPQPDLQRDPLPKTRGVAPRRRIHEPIDDMLSTAGHLSIKAKDKSSFETTTVAPLDDSRLFHNGDRINRFVRHFKPLFAFFTGPQPHWDLHSAS